jgi:30S ribosomal protein 3
MKRFVLKFLWLDKTIGVALDQRVGEKTLPLTEYYFWPQKDAWEEMKNCLEKKSWIAQNDSIVLLNQITEVINFWQDKEVTNRKDITKVREKFPSSSFVGFD